MSAGQVIVGLSLSVTVTVNEQVDVPSALVDSNVFVVVPTGKTEPLAKPAVWIVVSGPQDETVGAV